MRMSTQKMRVVLSDGPNIPSKVFVKAKTLNIELMAKYSDLLPPILYSSGFGH